LVSFLKPRRSVRRFPRQPCTGLTTRISRYMQVESQIQDSARAFSSIDSSPTPFDTDLFEVFITPTVYSGCCLLSAHYIRYCGVASAAFTALQPTNVAFV